MDIDTPQAHNWLQLIEVLRDDTNQLENVLSNLRIAIDQIKASFAIIENIIRLVHEADSREIANRNEA